MGRSSAPPSSGWSLVSGLRSAPDAARVPTSDGPDGCGVRGHPIQHVQELHEPVLPIVGEVFDLLPSLGPAGSRDHGHQHDRQRRAGGPSDDRGSSRRSKCCLIALELHIDSNYMKPAELKRFM